MSLSNKGVAYNKKTITFAVFKKRDMVFTIVFLILYGLGFGVCRLTAMLFSGAEAALVKNVAFIPIMNVITSILIVFFMFYIVKDYRRNKKKLDENKK